METVVCPAQPSQKKGWRPKNVAIVYGTILLLFLPYYFWQTTRAWHEWSFRANIFESYAYSAYGSLADAFLHGSVALREKPDPKLDQSPFPWDPDKRLEGTRFPWDYSYFRGNHQEGKLYLYFGPVPALVFYCPFKVVMGFMPSCILAFLIVSYLDLLLFAGLLRLVVARYLHRVPLFLEGVLLATFGLCNLMTFLQCTPGMYQMAIASAITFALGALICLLQAFKRSRWRYFWLVLASLSVGLAMGSRAPYIFLCFALGMMWIYLGRQGNYPSSRFHRSFVLESAALFAPVFFCGVGLLWYNYARFGNLFQFGNLYMLDNGDNLGSVFSLKNIPDSIWCYFFAPFKCLYRFPFVDAAPAPIQPFFFIPERGRENYVGLFLAFPVCLIAFTWFYYIRRLENSSGRRALTFFGLVATMWLCFGVMVIGAYMGVGFRYETEFQMPLLLLTTLALLARCEVGGKFQVWEKVVLSILVIYSCYVGVSYGLEGNDHWIQAYLYPKPG